MTEISEDAQKDEFRIHPDERVSSYKTFRHEGKRYLVCWWDRDFPNHTGQPPFWGDLKKAIRILGMKRKRAQKRTQKRAEQGRIAQE